MDKLYYELDITVYGITKYLLAVPISCVSFYLKRIPGLDTLHYLISNTGHWLWEINLKPSSSNLSMLSAITPPSAGRPSFVRQAFHHLPHPS